MILKEIANKTEQLEFKLWQLKDFALAVEVAIVEGPHDASAYEGALSLLTDLMIDADKDAKKIVDEMFDLLKAEHNDENKP